MSSCPPCVALFFLFLCPCNFTKLLITVSNKMDDRACCGCLHVKSATWIVAVVYEIISIVLLVANGVALANSGHLSEESR